MVGVPKKQAVVRHIEEGYALSTTNMQPGDKILSVNGRRITTTDKLIFFLTIHQGEEMDFVVKHPNGQKETIRVAPTKIETEQGEDYRFGLEIDNSKTHHVAALFAYPFVKTYSLLEQLFLTIESLITGKVSMKNLSGPVGIYSVVGESVQSGFADVLYLIAYLCINVGFINILPFPAFDGGRAFFLIIEKLRGKKMNSKTENLIHSVGFCLLMLLMVFITYNDIARLIR